MKFLLIAAIMTIAIVGIITLSNFDANQVPVGLLDSISNS